MTHASEQKTNDHELIATYGNKNGQIHTDLKAAKATKELPENTEKTGDKQINEAITAFRRKTDITLRDPISGLLNCDGFMKTYRETFSFRTDTKGPLHADEHGMLLLLDIQGFPLIEDVYGDAVAQNCLREVGDILGHFLQGEDAGGRLRDDQFIVLMRNTSLHRAMERLHKLSSGLTGVEVKAGTTRISLKVNIGLKPFRPGDTAEAILAGADLYKQTMIEEDRILNKTRDAGKRRHSGYRSDQKLNRGSQTMRQAMS